MYLNKVLLLSMVILMAFAGNQQSGSALCSSNHADHCAKCN